MKYYEITVTRSIPVEETITIDLLAQDAEEAQDLAYEIATSFPEDMDLIVDRCTIVGREYDYSAAKIDDIEYVESDVNERA